MIKQAGFILLSFSLVLGACSNGDNNEHNEHMTHDSEDNKIPKGMNVSKSSKFKKGDNITIKSDHMPGMKNAKGTVKGVYDTYAYVVSYEPTNGDKRIKNHKWVVNEEVDKAPKNGYKKGDSVKLNANHMAGMKGAKAKIEKVYQTDVYVVDYKSTEDGKKVKNHKWMTSDELDKG